MLGLGFLLGLELCLGLGGGEVLELGIVARVRVRIQLEVESRVIIWLQ